MRAVAAGSRQRFGTRPIHRVGLGAALAIVVSWASGLSFADPGRLTPMRMNPAAPPPGAKAEDAPKERPKKKDEKLYAFNMDKKPWGSVLAWLTERTGRPVIANSMPTGTFSYLSPPGKMYTLPEVIDIINEGMLANAATNKYYLINRERSFIVVPADDKVSPDLLPRITVDELDDRGRTELVQLVLPLKTLDVEQQAPEVKRMMGPFGEINPLTASNALLLVDTAGNLRRIKKTLDAQEAAAGAASNRLSYECKFIKASEAERILRDILGLGSATPSKDAAAAPARPAGKRPVFITSNEASNTVLITGPADAIAQAEGILKGLDVGKTRISVGRPELKFYTVPAGTADAISKTLSEAYKDSKTARISTGGNRVIVYATPEDQIEIARQVLSSTEKGGGSKTITLNVGDREAKEVAATLSKVFGDQKAGGAYVESVEDRNVVIVHGSEEQLEEARAIVKVITGEANAGATATPGGAVSPGGGASLGPRRRIISLGDNGSASALAEAIANTFSKMRKNPVEVVTPESLIRPEKKESERDKPKAPPRKDTDARAPIDLGPGVRRVALYDDDKDKGGLVDPRDAKKPAKDDRPGSPDVPVRILASGNRLEIISDDPKAVELLQQLVNLYTKSPGKGDYKVIKLYNSSAVDAAKTLDEIYNGKPQPQRGGGGFGGGRGGFGGGGGFPFGGGGGFPFGGGGGAPATQSPEDRVRVVAYPATNSLLIRATPLDMLAIERMIATAIDVEDTDPRGLTKTYRLVLHYASASEVATVLRDVYRQQTSGGGGRFGGRFGGGFTGLTNGDTNTTSNNNNNTPSLSLGVDDRTNSIVVACPEGLYKDIEKLVKEMDEASKLATRTIKVVSVQGIDPALVEQAVAAITGRPSGSRFGSGGFGGGGSPFGGGGFGGGSVRRGRRLALRRRRPVRGGGGSPFGGGMGEVAARSAAGEVVTRSAGAAASAAGSAAAGEN
ncbi:MAG: secretin N-terminal domain-containing protein [Gemmataceae bacterium]